MYRFVGFLASAMVAAEAHSCEMRLPDADFDLPPQVRSFIQSECRQFSDGSGETVAECIQAEALGYRVVVTMLRDDKIGEKAAERYRACQSGSGEGRFHRSKAECISRPFRDYWLTGCDREAAA